MNRFPRITMAVVATALFVATVPRLAELFIYDRQKILSGEIWRLFTSHFVHLTAGHLLWDVAAFAMIGSMIESKQMARFGPLCIIAPIIISAASLLLEPQMHRYAGLSALAMAAVVIFAFRQHTRTITIAILTLASAKLAFELFSGSSVFTASANSEVRVAALSHFLGALVGAAFALPIPACLSPLRWAKQVSSESPDHSRQIQRHAHRAPGR